MTKKFLTMTFLFAITSLVAMAQVATTYRGAFAPAPEPMWTENWTNWNPQSTVYGAPTVNVSGIITSNTTWTKNNVYLLQGTVYVDTLVTLTIEPGTVILGDANTVISALVIQRGAKLIANGTPCNPIVFTSSKAPGARTRGDWGGIIILGRAPNNLGNNTPVEGIGATNPRARFGGNIPNDNSGSLTYARIEYAGFAIAPGNEMNSLTMGSVGSATTIHHIQTSFGLDDAFEWFGGSVNCDHLVAYRCLDDDFDTDYGYSGIVQFGLGVKDPAVADDPAISTSEGFESDNNPSAPFTLLPKTSASFYNITQVGAFRCANNNGGITQPSANGFRRGVRLRRNTELKIFNSIFMNNWRGLVMDLDVLANGQAAFKNNIIAMDLTTTWVAPYAGAALAAENAATATYLNNPANGNSVITNPCDILIDAWNFTNPDFRPNAAGSGGVLAGADLTPSVQFQTTLLAPNQTIELLVDVFENGVGNSNGTITVTIPVPTGFTVGVPSIANLTATPTSGTNGTSAFFGQAYNNGDWNFSQSGGFITATSKPGVSIAKSDLSSLAFTLKRNASTPAGTYAFLVASVAGGSDNDASNNNAGAGVTAL